MNKQERKEQLDSVRADLVAASEILGDLLDVEDNADNADSDKVASILAALRKIDETLVEIEQAR